MGRMHCPDSASTDKKITEAYFQKVLISSVLGILLCMVCLVSTTWALFSTEIVSENNAITMGSFSVEVSYGSDSSITVSENTAGSFELNSSGEHTVKIALTDTSTTGYCHVRISSADKTEEFVTPTLSHKNGLPQTATFEIDLKDSTALTITVTPFWGESTSAGGTISPDGYSFGVATNNEEQTTLEGVQDGEESETELDAEDGEEQTDDPEGESGDAGGGTVTESTETPERSETPEVSAG